MRSSNSYAFQAFFAAMQLMRPMRVTPATGYGTPQVAVNLTNETLSGLTPQSESYTGTIATAAGDFRVGRTFNTASAEL